MFLIRKYNRKKDTHKRMLHETPNVLSEILNLRNLYNSQIISV